MGPESEGKSLLLKNGRYTIDFDGLERLADQKTRAYILCNPHNPTGRVWTDEELSGSPPSANAITCFCCQMTYTGILCGRAMCISRF